MKYPYFTEKKEEVFPDGTSIEEWFYDYSIPELDDLGKKYILTDYGIRNDGRIYTAEIQKLIDHIEKNGGGVLVVPAGTYMSGSLYFKQGVHLYVMKDGVLKGSDNICDYDIRMTRIEGETCLYFTALINADGIDGFVMAGQGIIDGNGMKSWKAFWLRRSWNPKCTNKDEQRPRLVFISNSKNILIAGLRLINSHFWTTHIYKCNYVKYLNCYIFSPAEPMNAPSTDAIDIDVCSDILIKNCYLEVNDDSVVLKGGKGPWANTLEENGSNERIIIEDCEYGFCHGCLTCGSESIHNRNIIMRRIKIRSGSNLLWFKMRPDTSQLYEYITVEDVKGKIHSFINIHPWTQFFDLKGRKEILKSEVNHIVMKNCKCHCYIFFDVEKREEQYHLRDFKFKNLEIVADIHNFNKEIIEHMSIENVWVEKGEQNEKK